MGKTFELSGLMFILYVIQIVITPIIFVRYFPMQQEVYWLLILTTVVVSVVGMIVISDRLKEWFLADLAYVLFMMTYNRFGAYGLGLIEVEPNHYAYDQGVAMIMTMLWGVVVIGIQAFIKVLLVSVQLSKNYSEHKRDELK